MEISVLRCVVLIISVIQVFSLQTLYLDDACFSTSLTYVDTAARIKASRHSTLNRNLNCSVIVRARPEDQLVAVVRSMNSNCKYTIVTAYDGENRNRKIEDMCGYSEFILAKRTFTSSRNALVFNLATTSSLHTGTYDIIVTSYSTGLCVFGDKLECNNGRCIDDSLECNGYNNCGDNSDEFNCATTSTVVVGAGIIVAIVLGGMFVVVCLPVIIVVMIFRRRRAYSKF